MIHPHLLNGEWKVFDVASQYKTRNNIMRDVVRSKSPCNTFVSLDLKPEHIGTHSICKSAITHGECGVTTSAPIAPICIHANWKISRVMKCYIWYENAGD